MKLSLVVLFAALAALSASFASATDDSKIIVDQDNTVPFFIGSEKLVGVSKIVATAATDNAAISSLLDAALSKKYDNATITAWRRLISGNATKVASSGPALSGEIKCFVGDDGQVTGLQYGSAIVCQKSSRFVNVKIGTNYVANIKVVVGKNAMIAGLQFIVTSGISGTSTSTYCGTKKGLSAYIGHAGKAVGAIGGTCSTSGAGRRSLTQNNSSLSTPGLVAKTFTSIVTPAPQGSNDSPPFGPSTVFVIDGQSVTPNNATNGTISGRRLRTRRSILSALDDQIQRDVPQI